MMNDFIVLVFWFVGCAYLFIGIFETVKGEKYEITNSE